MEAGEVIQVRGWSQYHDPKGRPEPESLIRNVVLSDISGSVYSIGELRQNRMSHICGIKLNQINLHAVRPVFLVDEKIEALQLSGVTVNGQAFSM